MVMWHTLSARFNDDELKVIREFQEKRKMSDNEFLRTGAQAILGLMAYADALQDPQVEVLRGFYEELQKEVNAPYFQKAMDRATERWAKKFKEQQIQKLDTEMAQIKGELEVFQADRKRGRPKIQKKRGRPVDKGN